MGSSQLMLSYFWKQPALKHFCVHNFYTAAKHITLYPFYGTDLGLSIMFKACTITTNKNNTKHTLKVSGEQWFSPPPL